MVSHSLNAFRRPQARAEDGVGLVEVMIAVFILGVAIISMAGLVGSSLAVTREARNRQQAVDAVSAAIEQIRAYGYKSIGYATPAQYAGDPLVTSGRFDHDAAGAGVAETMLSTAGGNVADFQTAVDHITVRRYLTWYDTDASPTTVGPQKAKRVTVVATWTDGSRGAKSVRQSTVVAEADRGLAAPAFSLSPASVNRTEQANQTLCFDHAITNQGERDKHDFTVSGTGTWTNSIDKIVGPTVSGSSWIARATLGGQPMIDQTSDLRPDSQVFLSRGSSLPLKVCYDVPAGATGTNTFTVTMRSAFDPTVTQSMTHTITIGAPGTAPSPGPSATPTPPGSSTHQGLFLKYTAAAASGRTFVMGADVPTRTTLPNYDVGGSDGDNLAGWRMEKDGDNSKNRTRWDWQYTGNGTVQLGGTGTLRFYSSWSGALKDNKTDAKALEYEIQIQVLDASKNLLRTLDTERHTYTHAQAGWSLRTVNFSFATTGANAKVSRNEYVRLQMRCVDGDESCHIAFDAVVGTGPAYTSALELPGASS